jgi:hypothetical protein
MTSSNISIESLLAQRLSSAQRIVSLEAAIFFVADAEEHVKLPAHRPREHEQRAPLLLVEHARRMSLYQFHQRLGRDPLAPLGLPPAPTQGLDSDDFSHGNASPPQTFANAPCIAACRPAGGALLRSCIE